MCCMYMYMCLCCIHEVCVFHMLYTYRISWYSIKILAFLICIDSRENTSLVEDKTPWELC